MIGQYLSALRYALNLIMIIEFNDYTEGSSFLILAQNMCNGLLFSNGIDKIGAGSVVYTSLQMISMAMKCMRFLAAINELVIVAE